ncbi:hypothetical protein G7Y79_00001g004120 [Physcia stellaris]|nr:hypothetical protein G7Y79_00001g004120 [Physcia stellaris]
MNTSSANKRKVINDFFHPLPKRRINAKAAPPSPQATNLEEPSGIYESTETSVPGLSLCQSFVTAAEEQQILDFLNDESRCIWRTDLSRRTMHFGGTYCLMPPRTASSQKSEQPKVLQAPPMPEELSWLIDRMVASGIFEGDKKPQYCIVNEYTGKLGISAHTENFQFGEPVVGLSLLSSCPIRFHELATPFDGSVRSGKAGKAEKTGKIIDVQLPERSLMVMRGESRWKWQHEIMRSSKGRGLGWKRVSLTFRVKDRP